MSDDPRGFSLPEILVALAIIAALSVVALPSIMNKLTEARAASLAQTLDGINDSFQSYRGNVGRFPRTLSQLTTKPTGGVDLCGLSVPAVNVNQWRGPYSSRSFETGGTRIGDGTIQDIVRRDPPTAASSTYAIAFVDVTDVEEPVASSLEASFDRDGNYGAGTIRWIAVPPGGKAGTLSFGIPVRGC